MKTLTTRNLLLTPVSLKDVPIIYKLIKEDNKALSHWTTIEYPITKNKIREYYQNAKKNDDFIFTIRSKTTKEIMGSINFLHKRGNNSGTIGYWIGKWHRNKGYTTEAVKRIIEYGFKEKRVVRIEITALEQNIPSQTVVKKCGLKYEGTQRMAAYNGLKEYGNLQMYSILRDEWSPTKKQI